jgi:hypothetical protein
VPRTRRGPSQLAKRILLELSNALSSDTEASSDLFQRTGRRSPEAVAKLQHDPRTPAHAPESVVDLGVAEQARGCGLRLVGAAVLDNVGEHHVTFSDWRLQADRGLRELEQTVHPRRVDSGFGGYRFESRLPCEPLSE